jgi:hypothetical protein
MEYCSQANKYKHDDGTKLWVMYDKFYSSKICMCKELPRNMAVVTMTLMMMMIGIRTDSTRNQSHDLLSTHKRAKYATLWVNCMSRHSMLSYG